jgi:hypothetical protein
MVARPRVDEKSGESKKNPDHLQGCRESVVAPSHTRDMIHPQLDAAGLRVFLIVFRAKFALPPDKVRGEIDSP